MSKLDYSEKEKSRLKKSYCEWYELPLEEVSKLEKLVTSWEKRGREEGREEGEKNAMQKIAKNMLVEGDSVKEGKLTKIVN